MKMKTPKYMGLLFATANVEKSKDFYANVLQQKIVSDDIPEHLDFEDFALQANFDKFLKGKWTSKPIEAKIDKTKPNNFQIYFEVDDLDYWVAKIKATEGIQMIHDIVETTYGQRISHFYDPDGHIVELAESFETATKRLMAQGLSIEEIAERFGDSAESVQQLLEEK